MTITHTEIDGVPTLFAEHSGPMIAGLTFRVGQADETLAGRGITHLLEHLVLHGHGLTDYHYNGSTGVVITMFHLQGGEDDIVAFLNGVCASLQQLPLHRLETERQVLRAEEGGRRGGPAEALALWRYGARTYGLPAYDEMGVPRLTGDDLHRWAQHWFTRQNAALWVAGERIPPALKLALPEGARRPVPAPTFALKGMPAFFRGNGTHVAYEGIVRRGVTGSVLAGVLERELYRSLRQEDGNSYTAAANYEPRGDGYAAITALADAVPDKEDAVLGGFVDVLAKLRAGRIDPADIEAVKAKAEDGMRGPMVEVGRLPSMAMDLLVGYPLREIDDVRAEMRALTVADVHGAAMEMLGTGLLQVPDGHDGEWAGFEPAPLFSDRQVLGQRYPDLRDGKVGLIIGPQGVGIDQEGCPPVAIPFHECAISLAYPDGGRQLIGFDSLTIRVEPTMYAVPPGAIAHIDAALAQVTVPQPPRDPRQIPSPKSEAPASAAPPAPAANGNTTGRLIGGVIALVLSGVALCCSGIWSWAVADNSDPANDVPLDATSLGINIFGYALTVGLAVVGVMLLRRRNRK
ncbi:insulinase family protein [Dactylosporangium sp. NPDC051484]|uniref:M16 family metallopeptidase n=1 Tax=Dactylosporangium sp. NPDC051484 TaxID=3154942 RepID=UPI003450DCA1